MKCFCVILLALLLALANAITGPIPEPSPVKPLSNITTTSVFWRGQEANNGKIYPCIRVPVMVKAEVGGVEAIAAFAECRMFADHACAPTGVASENVGDVDICMRTSSDTGETWGPLSIVIENAASPTAVFNAEQELLVLAYNSGGHNQLATSRDIGESWTKTGPIDTDWGNATNTMTGPGTAIILSAQNPHAPGRILFIGHHGDYQEDYVWYSDAAGKYTVSKTPLPLMDEGQLVELPNGDILASMRNNHVDSQCTSCRGISLSHDGGVTWSKVEFDARLLDPNCMASLIRVDDAIYYANPGNAHDRVNGTVLMSEDGTKTWKHVITVNPGGAFAGSSLSETMTMDVLGLLWETSADKCEGSSCQIVFSQIPLND